MTYRLLAFFLLILSQYAFAQPLVTSYQAFSVTNGEVLWVQVYHHDDPANILSEKLFNHLRRKTWITDLQREGDDIVGTLINYRPDYKRYGGTFRNTSIVVRTGKWEGKVRINVRNGKYRVILESLHYEAQQPATGSGKATIQKHAVSGNLAQWALNRYRTLFRKKRFTNLDIMHVSFKDSFTLVADQLIDSDW